MPTDEILKGHRRFREGFDAEREFFRALAAEGQSPRVLWIGCSDSRVVPEHITGARPGDIFVTRNIANVVPPPGPGAEAVGAVIEYAVGHLRVPHAVVCGHTECGGIAALGGALDAEREPHVARWLEWARPALEHLGSPGPAPGGTSAEAERANVLIQVENLRKYPCVADAVEAGALATHAWLYDVWTGELSAFDSSSGEWRALVRPASPPR